MGKNTAIGVSLVCLFLVLIPRGVHAKDQINEQTTVIVRVDGLSCPFCAFGLEKHLKNLEGAEEVTLFIKRGIAEIRLREGAVLPEDTIRQAVLDAGFTPRQITYRTAEGS